MTGDDLLDESCAGPRHPMISTCVASQLPSSGACAIHSGVQRAIRRSISMAKAAESNDTKPRRTASAAVVQWHLRRSWFDEHKSADCGNPLALQGSDPQGNRFLRNFNTRLTRQSSPKITNLSYATFERPVPRQARHRRRSRLQRWTGPVSPLRKDS
jgi:hypothetical protein